MSTLIVPRTAETGSYAEQVSIPRGMLADIRTLSLQFLPYEVCGLLGGHPGTTTPLGLTRCGNRAMDPKEAFFIDPDHHQGCVQRFSALHNWDVIGLFHSHPTKGAEPSQSDIGMIPHDLVSLIYSVPDDQIKAWRGATQLSIRAV